MSKHKVGDRVTATWADDVGDHSRPGWVTQVCPRNEYMVYVDTPDSDGQCYAEMVGAELAPLATVCPVEGQYADAVVMDENGECQVIRGYCLLVSKEGDATWVTLLVDIDPEEPGATSWEWVEQEHSWGIVVRAEHCTVSADQSEMFPED